MSSERERCNGEVCTWAACENIFTSRQCYLWLYEPAALEVPVNWNWALVCACVCVCGCDSNCLFMSRAVWILLWLREQKKKWWRANIEATFDEGCAFVSRAQENTRVGRWEAKKLTLSMRKNEAERESNMSLAHDRASCAFEDNLLRMNESFTLDSQNK